MSLAPANFLRTCLAAGAIACATVAQAAPAFVNGLLLEGSAIDASGGTAVNDGRLGYFSDIYYDPNRKEWWALSDRGPGGGTLRYETRLHRFKLDVDPHTGAISNFQLLKTKIFRNRGSSLDGFAPEVGGALGLALDPEGIVVHPRTGRLFVSDEYGPSLLEVSDNGRVKRRFETPANLLPRNALTGAVNHASDAGNSAGKRTNRGFEGLAISPDGRHVYAMLQVAMLDEGAGNGVYNRIVKFDTRTGRAVAQYAYKLEGSNQGRGTSALVALNEHEFLVLERNNRGLGVPDANLASPNKKVFRIALSGATDVSTIDLDAPGAVFIPVTKQPSAWLDLALPTTLADASLAGLGGVSPEKWEGLTIGPKLADGSYLVLAGTDNDYSVTQNGTGTQFDVYFRPNGATPSRMQCDIGTLLNCFAIDSVGAVSATPFPAGTDFAGYRLIPGVLHAYKASAADLAGYVAPNRRHARGGHGGAHDHEGEHD